MAQGGDFTKQDGTGGESIYGPSFRDENFVMRHIGPGLLSMANHGPHTNGSQFFITFASCPHLDGKHVVFGRLVQGMETLRKLEEVATSRDDHPIKRTTIGDCGEAPSVTAPRTPNSLEDRSAPWTKESDDTDAMLPVRSSANSSSSSLSGVKGSDRRSVDDEADPGEKAAPEDADDAPMSDKLRRLQELRYKLNQGRKDNRRAQQEEHARFTDPDYEKKKRAEQVRSARQEKHEELKAAGADVEALPLLHETAESVEARNKKKSKKKPAEFGWEVFTQDAQYNAYKRRIKNAGPLLASADSTERDSNSLEYNASSDRPSEAAIENMVAELKQTKDRRAKFSRRRPHYEGADVDYISERNRVFNKKLKRYFDAYTVETRNNLERGTAL